MDRTETSLREWLAANPPAAGRFTQTLASVAERAGNGEDLMYAVRELLDELAVAPLGRLAEAIAVEPANTGDPRHDAYLAALGEHLAITHALSAPAWTADASRFLDRFWFTSPVEGFRALAIAQSPAAFRRRGIFISKGALARV